MNYSFVITFCEKCSKQVSKLYCQTSLLLSNMIRCYVVTYKAVSSESLVNEVSSAAEKSRNICHGVVVYMEPEI